MVLGRAAAFTGRRCRLVMEFCFLAGQPRQFLIGRFRQQFCHRSQQRRDVHRFFEQRAGTGTECREELVRARGGDDNGNQWVVRGQLRKRIPPIPDRHIQVEQHQINWQGVGKIKRLLAVFSGNNKVIFAHEHVVRESRTVGSSSTSRMRLRGCERLGLFFGRAWGVADLGEVVNFISKKLASCCRWLQRGTA